VVAENQGEVSAIAANSSNVYWITNLQADNTAELRSAPIAGQGFAVVTREGLTWSAGLLAVDQTSAFVANQSSGGDLVGLNLSLGTMTWGFMQEQIEALFLDGSAIYYSAPYGVIRLSKVGPASGGRLELTGAGGPRLLMRDDDHLVVLDQSAARLSPRRLVRVRSDGSEALSEATVLLDDAPDFESGCADDRAYYFADAQRGDIVRLERDRAGSVQPLAEQEAIPRRLQIRAGFLYWTTDSGSELRSVAASGLDLVTLGMSRPTVATASQAGVFWASPDGIIWRLEP
jgi:hypothetical protein